MGASLCQDVALHLHLTQLPAQPHELLALGAAQPLLAGQRFAFVTRGVRHPVGDVCAEHSNSRDSSAGVLPPLHTNSVITRSSAGEPPPGTAVGFWASRTPSLKSIGVR